MLRALMAAERSPDPSSQVGAIIVDGKNRIIGSGYNGLPRGIQPKCIPWDRVSDDPTKTKYPYIVHAEKNAIYNALTSVEGSTLYATMYPCSECAKDILCAGIKRIVYLENPYEDDWTTRVAKWMFDYLDIPVEQHTWNQSKIESCLQRLLSKISTSA